MSKPAVGSPFVLCATLLGALGVVAFAGCSGDERAKPTPSSAGSSAHAGKGHGGGGDSTPSDGGAAGFSAAGGDGGGGPAQGGAPAAGAAGDAPGPPGVHEDPGLMVDACPNDSAPQPSGFAGVCTATKGWAPSSALAVTSGDAPALVAITPSELTLLWSQAQSSNFAYFLADRASTQEGFGEPQELQFQNVLGLSPDGLRLTLPAGDGGLLEATRAEAGDGFSDAEPGAYATLDSNAATLHLTLGDVAISADDRTLYYTAWSLDEATPYPLHVSQRSSSDPWPVGVALQSCEWKAYGAFGPQPSAVSSDGLTLFYFDSARGRARAAFRSTPSSDFSWFVDLPDLLRPQPNSACDRLYFSPKRGESRLLSAPRE